MALAGLVSALGTYFALVQARRRNFVQHPNARSSHHKATPTGGGLGIVLGGSVGAGFAVWESFWPAALVAVASLLIAAIGYRDDAKSLSAGLRLGMEALIIGAVIAFAIPLFLLRSSLGLAVPAPLLLLGLLIAGLYWVNLFNFMDGIDALAASQAVFVTLAAAAIMWGTVLGAHNIAALWWLLALAAASLGFLLFNWPPARIFMGDIGSLYLGFSIFALALQTIAFGWLSIWCWAILGAAFIADATVTLVRRLLQRERVFEAHRRHAYQFLARRFGSHRRVVLIFVAINLVWLLPLAYLAQTQPGAGWIITLAAYLPLVAAALVAGAGRHEYA